MILLTVGTQPMQFNRLIKEIDALIEEGIITQPVFAQIGDCTYIPKNMEYTSTLEKEKFDQLFTQCELIISHAGMGSINTALENNKPLIIYPRLQKFHEHVNDHQLYTAQKFCELGHVLACYCKEDFIEILPKVSTFVPKKRITYANDVANGVVQYINSII